jgi:hypothetical protein
LSAPRGDKLCLHGSASQIERQLASAVTGVPRVTPNAFDPLEPRLQSIDDLGRRLFCAGLAAGLTEIGAKHSIGL